MFDLGHGESEQLRPAVACSNASAVPVGPEEASKNYTLEALTDTCERLLISAGSETQNILVSKVRAERFLMSLLFKCNFSSFESVPGLQKTR